MKVRLLRFGWVLPLAALLAGCAPKIGRSCTLSTDCSQLGDRLCDITQPSGYCTIFNCEPDNCPDSICVGFDAQVDPACGMAGDVRPPRFERTFCMQPCGSQGDCRDGYVCVAPVQRNAEIVDFNPVGTMVCMAAVTLPPVPTTVPPICAVTDAGAPWTPYDPSASSSSASTSTSTGTTTSGSGTTTSGSGMGGAGGAGGMGGKGGNGGTGG